MKLLVCILFNLLISNVCFASITDIPLDQFVQKFSTRLAQVSKVHATGYEYFNDIEDMDVYKVLFTGNVYTRMYISCDKETNEINQITFMFLDNGDEVAGLEAVLRTMIALETLGFSTDDASQAVAKCVSNDTNGKHYMILERTGTNIAVAFAGKTTEKSKMMNFNIVDGDMF